MCDRISLLSKSSRKTKGQSRMDNPETLATLCAQYTRRRQSEQKAEHTTEYVTHIVNTCGTHHRICYSYSEYMFETTIRKQA